MYEVPEAADNERFQRLPLRGCGIGIMAGLISTFVYGCFLWIGSFTQAKGILNDGSIWWAGFAFLAVGGPGTGFIGGITGLLIGNHIRNYSYLPRKYIKQWLLKDCLMMTGLVGVIFLWALPNSNDTHEIDGFRMFTLFICIPGIIYTILFFSMGLRLYDWAHGDKD